MLQWGLYSLLYFENELVIDQYASSTKIKNDGLLEYPTISENMPPCFQGGVYEFRRSICIRNLLDLE